VARNTVSGSEGQEAKSDLPQPLALAPGTSIRATPGTIRQDVLLFARNQETLNSGEGHCPPVGGRNLKPRPMGGVFHFSEQ